MRSVLELALPGGAADRALVLGSGCPPCLAPTAAADGGTGSVDLAVIAPTDAECREERWAAQSARTCAERLDPDGIAYVLVAPRFRAGFRRRLEAVGLTTGPAVLHLPEVAESRDLVPLSRRAAEFAFEQVVPLQPWKRRAAKVAFALGVGRVLAARDARVGFFARREGARPFYDWLASPDLGSPAAGVIVRSSWRARGGAVVLAPVPSGGTEAIVKLSFADDRAPIAESELLERFGPNARRAGAAIPAPLPAPRLPGAEVAAQTRVPGELLAPALMRRPRLLGEAMAGLSAWLEEWHRLTASGAQLGERLEREILTPLDALVPWLKTADRYAAALHERCARVASETGPLVAAHNDLTMWNVLLDRRGRIGIVDWESAEEGALPLKDFYYATVDAVVATRGYADRIAAVRECFTAGGARAAKVGRLQAALARAAGASAELVDLSFHACWLGHAANELRSAGGNDATPFREIVQWLVDREDLAQERDSSISS